MTRSNPSNNRRTVYITAVGLLVLSLGAVFVVRSFGSESGADGFLGNNKSCDEPAQIQLTTTPEMQGALETAAKSLAGKGGKDGTPCLQFTISARSSAQVAQDVASGSDNRPDLWVPDSSLWVAQADDGDTVPTIAVPSIATSPMVLVGPRSSFADTSSWLRTLADPNEPALQDPLSSSSGALALLAIQAERAKKSWSDTQVSDVIVPMAQRLGSSTKASPSLDTLFSRAAQSGAQSVVPASEQAFVKYQEAHPDAQLRAIVPATGTLYLDYPIVVTAKAESDQATTAANALAGEMLSDSYAQARSDAGFRDISMSALSGGRGVGDGISQLAKPTNEAIDKSLLNWTRLSLSTHSLAVIDISGSMADKVGTKTRMQLTIEATTAGLSLFPPSAKLGLWTFSTGIGPNGVGNHRELVPIAALSPNQRAKITNNLKVQKPTPNGGTSLYETAIAAVNLVSRTYDPTAVNSVLLFTDGKNDDKNGPTLPATIKLLKSLNDQSRPVRIIALGMGPDVNPDELRQLAQATGGQAYVARDPADLRKDFINALQNR
ncbi:substrate-binding domain-containing protein [Kribbella sp. NPDC055071]